ncbi:hypothetical protein BKA70DRAFT_680226 [Coprinopsis sp. MPI-PUGE-AT-0042]|nr:hypothetical protein BKA70DRAFT_680226 [Coprinopsis sp. MPI-PUGE-AT-0042]
MFQRLEQDLDTQYYAPLCADVVVIITSYSIYPPILKALRRSLLQQPLTPSQLTGINVTMQSQGIIIERDRTTSRSMAEIRDALVASYDVYTYLTQGKDANAHLPDICDYSEHAEDSRTYKQGRACSGCQSALYCSRQCQKRDWELHKHECQQGRKFREESKAKDDWYAPTWRKFHVARILDHYADSEIAKMSVPIARLDCQRGVAAWVPLKPENYDVETLEGPETSSQLNSRFSGFLLWIKESSAQSRREKRRLLEQVFPFGDKVVILSVKVTLNDDVINAGASIVRMGPVPLPDVSDTPGEYGGLSYNPYN